MRILGISDSQDAGVAIINTEDNRTSAVNEERLTGVKLKGGFPIRSIKEVVKWNQINTDEIDLVVIASHMTPSWVFRNFCNMHAKLRSGNKQFSFLLSLYISYQVIARKSKIIEHIESFLSRFVVEKKLRKIGIKAKLINVEHHEAHAYAAYTTSGFNEALIITIDGLGDGISFTVNIGREGKVNRIFEQQALNDITLYYSRLTEFLGFTAVKDEGKVMGLAGYYSNNNSNLSEIKGLLRAGRGRFKQRNLFSRDRRIYNLLKSKSREEIASAFQSHLEKIIVSVITYWVEKTNIKNIALGGGFFANIKVNQKISEIEKVENVYIFPHMGDGGLAFGAACAVRKSKPFRLKDVFWGPSFSKDYIRLFLEKNKINFEFIDDIAKHIAYLLTQGKIVARFCGAMEYGPRALGNRSILAQATDTKIQKLLNKKLGRDEFMPFAPAILEEYSRKCCLGVEKAAYTANFMNISFQCTEYFKKSCPVVVHRDGTTRPQFVNKDCNSGFYAILSEYKNITGIPAFINTSFNIHDRPIVCTPEDAFESFLKGGLDYLAIDNFLLRREINE